MKLITNIVAAAAAFILITAPVLAVPSTGDNAPKLQLKDIKGKPFDLNQALKKGPVFVSFWATWCLPCREEFPLVSNLSRKFSGKGVSVISVAVRDRQPAVMTFVKEEKPAQIVAIDANNAAFNAWNLRAVPIAFLVGKNGRIAAWYDQFDASDIPAIESDIQKALKTSGK